MKFHCHFVAGVWFSFDCPHYYGGKYSVHTSYPIFTSFPTNFTTNSIIYYSTSVFYRTVVLVRRHSFLVLSLFFSQKNKTYKMGLDVCVCVCLCKIFVPP